MQEIKFLINCFLLKIYKFVDKKVNYFILFKFKLVNRFEKVCCNRKMMFSRVKVYFITLKKIRTVISSQFYFNFSTASNQLKYLELSSNERKRLFVCSILSTESLVTPNLKYLEDDQIDENYLHDKDVPLTLQILRYSKYSCNCSNNFTIAQMRKCRAKRNIGYFVHFEDSNSSRTQTSVSTYIHKSRVSKFPQAETGSRFNKQRLQELNTPLRSPMGRAIQIYRYAINLQISRYMLDAFTQ